MIQAVANAFPDNTDFALYMEELESQPECLGIKTLKWRWNFLRSHLHRRIREQTSDKMTERIRKFTLPKTADRAQVKAHVAKVSKFYKETSEVTLVKLQQFLTDTKHPALIQAIANHPLTIEHGTIAPK